MLMGLRPDDPLHGEARIDMVFRPAGVNRLQVVKQRGTLEPRHFSRLVDHVVTVERGERDGGDFGDVVEARSERVEILHDAVENPFVVVDEIHLVHRDREVANFEEVGHKRMAFGLFDNPFARVDEDDGEVGGGSTRDHVARVLNVTRGVGNDELTARGGKVTVSHVDRDALFALGAEPIGEQREVDHGIAAAAGTFLHRAQLVLENALRVVEQAADKRRLAVIDRTSSGKTEKVHQK